MNDKLSLKRVNHILANIVQFNERSIIMEKKVYFKLHKVKKQWVTIAVTGLALGLSFASLGYVSAAEQTHPTSEPTVENSIQENAIDVVSSSTNEVITKPEENKSFDAPNTRENITETTSTSWAVFVSECDVSELTTSLLVTVETSERRAC